MVVTTEWLVDKSALVRLGHSRRRQEWATRIERGLVHISTVTLLEVGFSTRNGQDHHRTLSTPPIAAMPPAYSSPAAEDRAIAVQAQLAARGQHRAPSIPDLLVAATAELAGLVVLHLDKDFDLIAGVTGQPTEMLDLAPVT